MHNPVPFTACLLLALVCASAPAVAQRASVPTPEQQALAERLFREAKANMDQGEYETACPQLEESMRQDPGGGTQLTLALCYEGAGRTASAWAAYLEAAAQARRDARSDREAIATDRAKALEARLINLHVVVPSEVAQLPGFSLSRNGVEIPAATFAVPFPVDPGTHEFEARAEGYEAWQHALTVSEQNLKPSVEVPMLTKEAESSPAVVPVPVETSPSDAGVNTPAAEPVEESGLSQREWGYIVGGVGVVSLAVGTVFGVRAINKANTVNDACPERECDRRFEGDFGDWETASRVADITVGLGLVGVGIGAYLIVSAEDEHELSVSAVPTRGGGAFRLRQTF